MNDAPKNTLNEAKARMVVTLAQDYFSGQNYLGGRHKSAFFAEQLMFQDHEELAQRLAECHDCMERARAGDFSSMQRLLYPADCNVGEENMALDDIICARIRDIESASGTDAFPRQQMMNLLAPITEIIDLLSALDNERGGNRNAEHSLNWKQAEDQLRKVTMKEGLLPGAHVGLAAD